MEGRANLNFRVFFFETFNSGETGQHAIYRLSLSASDSTTSNYLEKDEQENG